ncbi:MAG: SDR family NAD(P)-dependent oxidoreductase [Coxiellaceae bacterium]|nr:SDR family NAD(P)-dependent oxidoreductase [Coxiellaceae bacterium]
MKEFDKKTAVITGAGSGIGKALAKKCAQHSMRLVLVDIDATRLENVKKELEKFNVDILAHACDVGDEAQIQQLVAATLEKFGTPSLLFNNAGIAGTLGAVWEMECADIERVHAVNFLSVVYSCRHFIPTMLAAKHPCHIINTASITGLHTAANMTAYMTSKHAVVALTEILQRDLIEREADISVSVLCPGMVETQLATSMTVAKNAPEHVGQVAQYFEKIIKVGMSADDVADMTFEAINKQQFYILTHFEEHQELITERFQKILKR